MIKRFIKWWLSKKWFEACVGSDCDTCKYGNKECNCSIRQVLEVLRKE
jgi:hypothetical protein